MRTGNHAFVIIKRLLATTTTTMDLGMWAFGILHVVPIKLGGWDSVSVVCHGRWWRGGTVEDTGGAHQSMGWLAPSSIHKRDDSEVSRTARMLVR